METNGDGDQVLSNTPDPKFAVQQGTPFVRSLLNAIPMPIFYKDRLGRYLGVNQAFERFYGKTDQEMVGKTVFDVAPPELAEIYYAKDQEFFINPGLQIYEANLKNVQGVLHDVVFHKVPFYADDGTVAGMIGVIVDITEQKRLEREARRRGEVQAVLREISETTVSPLEMQEIYVLVHRLIARVLLAENFYISLLDEELSLVRFPYCVGKASVLPTERPTGKGLTEYIARIGRAVHLTPLDIEQLQMKGQLDPEQSPPMEWLGAPLIDLNGKIFGLVVIFQMEQIGCFASEDLEVLIIIAAQFSLAMQRRKAAEELLESEARYRALVHQAPEALLLCDPHTGEIVEANARFTEQFGYDIGRDGPLNVFNLLEAPRTEIRETMDAAIKTGIVPVQRRLARHRNGSLVHLERSASLVRYGKRQLLLVTIRDVSEEVRREQSFIREAQLASRVQAALLQNPAKSPWLEVVTIYQPQGFVGGDLYFLDWRYNGSILRGFLMDTAGHGLGTALHTSALHLLLREINEQDLPLSEQVAWLNRRASQYFDEASFAAALVFEIDLTLRKLRWVCAGIPDIRVATADVRGIVARSGMYLGIRPEEIFEVHELALRKGDAFYFLTDGLTDRIGLQTDLPFDRFNAMVKYIETLARAPERRDDATAICIKVKALPERTDPGNAWPRVMDFNGYGDYQRFRSEISCIVAAETGTDHSIQEVAVNEALANALECRDGIARQHRVRLRFHRIGRWFIVRVRTTRMGFAGNAMLRRLRATPDKYFSFGEDVGMGRGLPIMLSTADRMVYNDEGTELLLGWKLGETKLAKGE